MSSSLNNVFPQGFPGGEKATSKTSFKHLPFEQLITSFRKKLHNSFFSAKRRFEKKILKDHARGETFKADSKRLLELAEEIEKKDSLISQFSKMLDDQTALIKFQRDQLNEYAIKIDELKKSQVKNVSVSYAFVSNKKRKLVENVHCRVQGFTPALTPKKILKSPIKNLTSAPLKLDSFLTGTLIKDLPKQIWSKKTHYSPTIAVYVISLKLKSGSSNETIEKIDNLFIAGKVGQIIRHEVISPKEIKIYVQTKEEIKPNINTSQFKSMSVKVDGYYSLYGEHGKKEIKKFTDSICEKFQALSLTLAAKTN